MRLFEYEGGLPDLHQFITPKLIDEIIHSGKWVSHGSELEDWLSTSCYASDYEKDIGIDGDGLEQLPYAEQREHPDFRKCIEHYVTYAVNHFDGILRHGDPYEKLAPFGPTMTLYRCMGVDQAWLDNPQPHFGIFWTAVPGQAKRFLDASKPFNVIMKTEVRHVYINWYETLRSRLDYNSGFDEHEFQLVKDSKVEKVEVLLMKANHKTVKSGLA